MFFDKNKVFLIRDNGDSELEMLHLVSGCQLRKQKKRSFISPTLLAKESTHMDNRNLE